MQTGIMVFTALLSISVLAGCSSTPTLGKQMAAASADSAALSAQWQRGDELASKGRKLIEKGRDRVEDGNEMIEDGNDKIAAGNKLIDKGRDAIAAGKDEQERGADMLRRGEAAREESERLYAERYPELYRQITATKAK